MYFATLASEKYSTCFMKIEINMTKTKNQHLCGINATAMRRNMSAKDTRHSKKTEHNLLGASVK